MRCAFSFAIRTQPWPIGRALNDARGGRDAPGRMARRDPLGLLLVPRRGRVDGEVAAGAARSVLLHDVRELVSEQAAAVAGGRRIGTAREDDVSPDCVR